MDASIWNDALEILIFWAAIYAVLRSLRGTRGLGILKGGVAFFVGLYLFSKLLMPYFNISLERVTFLLESLVTAALIAFVIIFQPEVRRGLTRLGENPLSWFSGRAPSPPSSYNAVAPIVDAAGRMSRRRIGALIAIERGIGIVGVIESGVPLNAEVSAPLLESIFYPNAPLHDGAVVVRGNSIVAASCLLPLSDNPALGPEVGTRHRAAVGLSEESDAVSVVVSEQTGRISVAFRGGIRAMRDTRELASTLNVILDGGVPDWVEAREAVVQRAEPREDEDKDTRERDKDKEREKTRELDEAEQTKTMVAPPRVDAPRKDVTVGATTRLIDRGPAKKKGTA